MKNPHPVTFSQSSAVIYHLLMFLSLKHGRTVEVFDPNIGLPTFVIHYGSEFQNKQSLLGKKTTYVSRCICRLFSLSLF